MVCAANTLDVNPQPFVDNGCAGNHRTYASTHNHGNHESLSPSCVFLSFVNCGEGDDSKVVHDVNTHMS